MTISEKVAYLKGMFDGMELDTEKSKEARMIGAVLEVLEQIGTAFEGVSERFDVLEDDLDAMSDALTDLEDEVFDEYEDKDEDEDEDDDFFEIECPNCGEPLYIDEDILDEGMIQCPNCEQKFVLDLSDEEDECECCCDEDDDCGCDCCCEDDDEDDEEE